MGRGGPGGRGGQDYASPVAAGGKLYFVSRSGNAYVAALEPEFKLLATNHFESDHSGFTATPAISNGQLFIRSDKHLYCVSQ
jgi:outer membrane protein assembly factor BamB